MQRVATFHTSVLQAPKPGNDAQTEVPREPTHRPIKVTTAYQTPGTNDFRTTPQQITAAAVNDPTPLQVLSNYGYIFCTP